MLRMSDQTSKLDGDTTKKIRQKNNWERSIPSSTQSISSHYSKEG